MECLARESGDANEDGTLPLFLSRRTLLIRNKGIVNVRAFYTLRWKSLREGLGSARLAALYASR